MSELPKNRFLTSLFYSAVSLSSLISFKDDYCSRWSYAEAELSAFFNNAATGYFSWDFASYCYSLLKKGRLLGAYKSGYSAIAKDTKEFSYNAILSFVYLSLTISSLLLDWLDDLPTIPPSAAICSICFFSYCAFSAAFAEAVGPPVALATASSLLMCFWGPVSFAWARRFTGSCFAPASVLGFLFISAGGGIMIVS